MPPGPRVIPSLPKLWNGLANSPEYNLKKKNEGGEKEKREKKTEEGTKRKEEGTKREKGGR